ncbi:MAG: hypothetical protein K9G48_00580 [Reyranella sp.]|nr:hypothetical protein [Reyranella sp.]
MSLLFIRAPGSYDVRGEWLPWLETVHRLGLLQGYAEIDDMYPPGTISLLLMADELLPMIPDLFAIKVLIAMAQLGAGLLFTYHCRSSSLAVGFVLAITLSGSALCYLDILFAVPLLVSLYAALDKRPALSVATFIFACFIKWQPLILVPFLAVLWFEQARSLGRHHLLATAGTAALAIFPVTWMFWPAIGLAFGEALTGDTWSGNALNLPWLVQLVLGYSPGVIYDVAESRQWMVRSVFAAIYLPLLVAAARWHRNQAAEMLMFATAGFLAYFLLAPSVHENHLFVPMVVGFVLYSRTPKLAPLAICIALFANANLLLFFGFDGNPLFEANPTFAAVTGTLAAVALLAFGLLFLGLLRRVPEPIR